MLLYILILYAISLGSGNILNIGIGEKGGGQITTASGGCHPQLSTIPTSSVQQTSRKALGSAGGGCPPTTSMYTERSGSPLIAGATSYSLPPLNTYSPVRTPMYLDQVSIHEGTYIAASCVIVEEPLAIMCLGLCNMLSEAMSSQI